MDTQSMKTNTTDVAKTVGLAGAGEQAGTTATASNSPQASQYIMVDAMRLSKGLKTTFWGLALVFDSIGVPIDIGMPKGMKNMKAEAAGDAGDVAEAQDDKVAENVVADDASDADEVENGVEADKPEPKATKGKKGSKAAKAAKSSAGTVDEATEPQTAEPQSSVPSAPAISIDDITKIIVQKIKKDRKNNEKIGAILKTYGIAKVSDLPTDKYEAFLTDLSAI